MSESLIRAQFDRRQFVVGGAAVLFLASCSQRSSPMNYQAAAAAPASTVRTVSELFALAAPFYVAHRGSGDNWPEHTALAYSNAAAAGAQAIEISVNATADGVLVCHHDKNIRRMTGVNRNIAEMSWSELQAQRNDARRWLGPLASLEPIPRLSDVLDDLAAEHVIFIEDKTGSHTTALLALMDSYPDATEHFVWKQWAGAKQHQLARKRGYKTWGYVTSDLALTTEMLDGFDYLGIHHSATDAAISRLVARGKPVIAWEVHRRSMRDRLLKLGVVGMMCSNIPYVMGATLPAVTDSFGSGVRAPGDLPWTTDLGWKNQPQLIPDSGSVVLAYPTIESYHMGSFAPVDTRDCRISFRLRWPDGMPASSKHAGLSFGLASDHPYRVGISSKVSGYHAILRANGRLDLYERTSGIARGTLLGSVPTPAPAVGEWVDLVVSISGARITVSRGSNPAWKVAVDDSRHRGGYFSLGKNYADPIPVEFSAVRVE